jgi:hypothetical protein
MANLAQYNTDQFQTLMNDLDFAVSALYNESINDFEDINPSTLEELKDSVEDNIKTLNDILSQLKWKTK